MSKEPNVTAESDPAADVAEYGHDGLYRLLHELRQPLNNIQLAAILLRKRTVPLLEGAEQEYLTRRLDRIEGQVVRAVEIANRLAQTV